MLYKSQHSSGLEWSSRLRINTIIYRELLEIQEYAMHTAPLDCNLKKIAQQWDRTIVKFLLDRMATEAGVQLKSNSSLVVKSRV